MSGTFLLTISEARGFTAVAAEIDRLAVVVGCSSGGSGQSAFYLSGASAVTGLGYGDAVETLTQIIEQQQDGATVGTKYPAAMYSTADTVPGSYGTIDDTGFAGLATVAVDATSEPYITADAQIRFIAGGIVGVAGITYQTRLGYGGDWSRTMALGTDTSITIPTSNAKFDFSPTSSNLTALNTMINEEVTDYNAHVILTTGTVHTNADTVDQVDTGAYPSATNTATRVARMGALIVAAKLHVIKGSGGTPATHINVGGDTVALAALNAIPAVVDDVTALNAAIAFKALFNTHNAGTTWHTIADATNTVTSPTPTAGSINTDDVVRVRTFAPAPDATGITAAFTALAAGSAEFSILVLDFPLTVALANTVSAGLDALALVGREPLCIARYRLPDFETDETRTEWGDALEAEFSLDAFDDSRIHLVTEYGLLTDAMTQRQYLRSGLAQTAADFVRVPRAEWPDAPADQPMANFTLIDEDGDTVGHDEGARGDFTGLSNDTLGNRFGCVQRLSDSTRREQVFKTVPWVLYAEDERIRNAMARRLVNALRRVVRAAGTPLLGGRFFFTTTGPTTGTLTDASRQAIHGIIFQDVSDEFGTEFENAADAGLDTGLIQVSPNVTLSGGDIVGLSVTAAPDLPGYAKDLSFVIAVQR
jgi:hypothetical protein